MGSCSYLDRIEGSEVIQFKILDKLNDSDCFDFDYKPSYGDRLDIILVSGKSEKTTYEFYFNDSEWEISTPFVFYGYAEEDFDVINKGVIQFL